MARYQVNYGAGAAEVCGVHDLLVVPSARTVPPELEVEFGPIPPALIPLDGRPAMRFVAETAPAGTTTIVAGHDGIELLREAAARSDAVTVVDVGPTDSLAATIAGALAGVEPRVGRRLVVNFADTLVADLPHAGDAIAYRVQADSFRWTTFTLDPHAGIGALAEKEIEKHSAEALPVFVGVFAFADEPAFRRDLAEALAAPDPGVDPFYTAVAAYVRAHGGPAALFETRVWHDFGHLDTYYRTRQRFLIDRRAFNEVEVDARRGVIRKTSTNVDKLRRETAWYLALPPHLSHLAPRVLGHGEGYVDMEFYGYPSLADTYLFGALDTGAWALALDAIDEVALSLHAEHAELPPVAASAVMSAMYDDKTSERLTPVLADDGFAALRGDELTIDGRPALGLDGALEVLPAVADAVGLCAPRPLGIIHGDLCLSNILYDRRNGIVRLIDPRGTFGGLPLHGDPLYDRAKLAHSIEGDYDHLVRGLFDVTVAPGAFALDVHLTAGQRAVKELYAARAARRLGADLERVRLIEALLFLTMIPLHADRPRSQLAFLARGLGLLTDVAQAAGVWRPALRVAA
jgi:hypothetical protein